MAAGLPPGLTLGASTGTISGTPTTAGTYSFTVQVTASLSPQSASRALSLTVDAAPAVEPPSNLEAVGEEDRVDLQWTASRTTGVTYSVYRATWSGSCGTFETIATGIGATSYRDEGLPAGTTATRQRR